MKLHDTRGVELTIGATVMHSWRHSSHMGLDEATVVGFSRGEQHGKPVYYVEIVKIHDKDRKVRKVYQTNNLVVVEPMRNVPSGITTVRTEVFDSQSTIAYQQSIIAAGPDLDDRLQTVAKHIGDKVITEYIQGK